jgi:superfamily II DNA/RNA helicase
LPSKEDEFTHRNGRTARMLSTGTAYIIRSWEWENGIYQLWNGRFKLESASLPKPPDQTIYISGGRK